jgi:hypothetical protein
MEGMNNVMLAQLMKDMQVCQVVFLLMSALVHTSRIGAKTNVVRPQRCLYECIRFTLS